MKKSLFLLIFSAFVQLTCFSQLTVTTNSIATSLAQNIVGSGLTVTNATLNCNNGAAGTFTFTSAGVGIPNGVILTTGSAVSAEAGSISFASEDYGTTYHDPALTSVSSNAINDVCILTFDFVPLCNTVEIKFVFGSEEYPEFVNQGVNDGFGIFLTGPNPGGGNYVNHNYATLPNGIPVSIDNVNANTNSSYYHDNSSGPTSSYFVYDGYTSVITASVAVIPCQNYTMEVAIGDGGDGAYDSGVLIQANSISCSNTPTVTTSVTAANCGNTGSATTTVTNYTGTPTYQWLPGNATTPTINNLAAGTYTCLVGMQSGCGLTTQTVTAVVPSIGSVFSFTTSAQNPLCNNNTNGSAGVALSGGTGPYTYTWTTTPPQNTATTTASLPAGIYTVNMTDNAGCTGSTTVTLVNPPSIAATVTTSPTTCTASIGVATASVTSGGTAPFGYLWSTSEVSQTISGLAQGTYSVLITDINTCTATATGSVTTQGFNWTASATATNPKCAGSASGTATVTINNPGTNTFLYSWNTSPVQTTSVTTPALSAGNYIVTVSDLNGCVNTASVTLTDPPPVTATVNTSPTICSGSVGSATVTILSGGTAPFQYTWLTNPAQPLPNTNVATNLPQGTCSVYVTDANGCNTTPTAPSGTVLSTGFTWVPVATSTQTKCFGSSDGTATVAITNAGASTFTAYAWTPTAQTNSVATQLPAGNYTVTVTDNNGCIGSTNVTVLQSDPITASIQTSPDLCNKGVGTATVTSTGLAPYTYTWTTSPVIHTQTADSLKAGTYSVSLIDANLCSTFASTTIVNQNDVLASQFLTSPEGEIDAESNVALSISANTGWSVDSAYLADSGSTVKTPITSNPFNYSFPKYGDYTVTYYYTSANGCKDTVTEYIIVKDYITLYIPNAFTPNGDGLNENFAAEGTFVNKFEMYIYDRWGSLVTKLDNINKAWDGSKNGAPAPSDTYVYKGTAYDVFGKHVNFHGQVNLIR